MSDVWQVFLTGLGRAVSSPEFAIDAATLIVALALYHFFVVRPRLQKALMRSAATRGSAEPEDVSGLRSRIAALEGAAKGALSHVGFVRFNAFPDVGSELSYSLAVVDGHGNGFVVSSIYSREEVRTYAKAVKQFAADKEVSSEEREALKIARDQAVPR